MKILVTGTAGFIGFHLAKKLLERGDEVVGLDNINDYYDVNLKYGRLEELGIDCRAPLAVTDDSHCEELPPSLRGTKQSSNNIEAIQSTKYKNHRFYKMDLADKEAMENLFITEKFDAVCNLAAQAGVRYSIENPHAYVQSNIVGFLNILEGCRNTNVKNLAFASSSSVYGLNESQPFKTTDPTEHQVSLYAATKKSNEMMAHTYAHLYGIHVTGLRFFTVYGPWGRPDMAPMLFTDAILNDRAIKVFNNGKMSRDFTYIDDIVDGVIKVIDNPAQGLDCRATLAVTEVPSSEELSPSSEELSPSSEELSLSSEELSLSSEELSLSSEELFPSLRGTKQSNHPLPIDRSTAPYRLYNIGNNAPLPLMTFIETIENALGKKAEKIFLPMQDGDVVSTYADVSGLINDFGYKPDTELKDGIGEFVTWYREFYKTNGEEK